MTEYGPICPKLALSQIARYEIRKQTSPLERFRDPPLPLSACWVRPALSTSVDQPARTAAGNICSRAASASKKAWRPLLVGEINVAISPLKPRLLSVRHDDVNEDRERAEDHGVYFAIRQSRAQKA